MGATALRAVQNGGHRDHVATGNVRYAPTFIRKSRRGFLGSLAAAAGGAPFVAGGLTHGAEPDDAPSAPDADATPLPPDDCPVVSEACEQHHDLLRLRSALGHEALERSRSDAGARPVTVAAWQMRNRCDGEAGKRANLERMLAGIERAAGEGAQVIAFPEMCLQGYFTGVSDTPPAAARANHSLADRVGESEYLKALRDAAWTYDTVVAFEFCEHDGEEYPGGANEWTGRHPTAVLWQPRRAELARVPPSRTKPRIVRSTPATPRRLKTAQQAGAAGRR